MTQMTGQRTALASRPKGRPTPGNFRVEAVEHSEPKPGEVLLETLYLSLDPICAAS